jgi:hypothetical protein
MAFPPGSPVIDTMIGFPHEGFAQYDFIRRQTRDRSSREEMEFPVEYIFKGVPKDLPTDDPVAVTLGEMDKYGIERGLIGVADETSRAALKAHPDRFIARRSPSTIRRCTRSTRPAWTWAFPSSCAPASRARG